MFDIAGGIILGVIGLYLLAILGSLLLLLIAGMFSKLCVAVDDVLLRRRKVSSRAPIYSYTDTSGFDAN